MMLVSGVRSSCDTIDMKSALLRSSWVSWATMSRSRS